MSGMPWVKIDTDILEDPKFGQLTERASWRFIQFILLAGKIDAEGYIVNGDVPLSLDDIAWRFRINEEILKEDLFELDAFDLVIFDDEMGAYLVVNFSKRQGRSQTEKRKQWVERQRKHREKIRVQKDEIEAVTDEKENVTGDYAKVTGDEKIVTPLEERREEEEKIKEVEEEERVVGVVSTLFQNEIGGLTGMIREQIIDWVENYPLEWIEDSIRIASGNNKRRVDYINGILKKKKIEGHGDNEQGEGKENGIDMEKQREEEAKASRERIERLKAKELDDG